MKVKSNLKGKSREVEPSLVTSSSLRTLVAISSKRSSVTCGTNKKIPLVHNKYRNKLLNKKIPQQESTFQFSHIS
jgi:hypothetical protein